MCNKVTGRAVARQRKLMCNKVTGRAGQDNINSCAVCERRTDQESHKTACLLTKLEAVPDDDDDDDDDVDAQGASKRVGLTKLECQSVSD